MALPPTIHDEPPVGSSDPFALVMGNCQAESLRIVLHGPGLATVRVPPVHELVAEDLPRLERWLDHVRVLVCQPIRDGFGGLPVGTAQLAARLGARARLVVVPVVRCAGLFPTHALVRPPADPGLAPPLVAYHDLRVLAAAAGLGDLPAPDPATVRRVHERSQGELRHREQAHGTVVVSDVLDRPDFDLMRTLNHPGNRVFAAMARRVRDHLGLPAHDGDPGRPLLSSVRAPREAAVVEAFDLEDEPEPDWHVEGLRVAAGDVRAAHAAFYAARPDVVAAGLARHRATLELLGAR